MSEAAAPLPPPGPPAPNMNMMPDIEPDMSYVVPEDAIRQFHEQGFCTLKNFLSEQELQFIDEVYAKFLSGEIKPEGKDLCDMSDTTGKRTFDQYSIVNAMLPTKCSPPSHVSLPSSPHPPQGTTPPCRTTCTSAVQRARLRRFTRASQ
jgi:hypothetical protein